MWLMMQMLPMQEKEVITISITKAVPLNMMTVTMRIIMARTLTVKTVEEQLMISLIMQMGLENLFNF